MTSPVIRAPDSVPVTLMSLALSTPLEINSPVIVMPLTSIVPTSRLSAWSSLKLPETKLDSIPVASRANRRVNVPLVALIVLPERLLIKPETWTSSSSVVI